ncbi:photosynthetic NDH subunit of subcomplex B 4, chloroplastic [Lolium rigidum]|uniref:photosynthetic NDH subunit of subcomplex B 4, chloroplastic n=1 Tax=Lolium rigidum TaxID=89674 RepID=UPI001F5CBDFE|nr:photosynthetic NDH subunit of subcomplex B 4, chloroplastic [Lolium rigidum]
MASAPLLKPHSHCSALPSVRRSGPATVHAQRSAGRSGAAALKARAFPLDVVPLMVTMVEHVDNQRDWVVTKSIWHLSDTAIKGFYTFYAMFTVWGICFFGSMKDPFYDSEYYREQGGDGTVHWYYDRQEDLEASAREELLREDLLEEIEKRVGGLRELEEAGIK